MATEQDFVHLHVHTQYSLLDGAIKLNQLIKKTKEYGMDSVAITDHGVMFGVVEFYEKAKSAGIKPIIGCECYVAPRTISDKTNTDKRGLSHLVLLAKNNEGYKSLCKLASIAQLEGFYYKPRIDKEVLEANKNGLIALSACLHGEIPRLILEKSFNEADDAARFYQRVFGENNFYLEMQNNGLKEQDEVNQALIDMSKRLSIPLVATNDCHYLNKEDAYAHDVLLCVQTGKTINDSDRLKFGTDSLYFKPPSQMLKDFKDYPSALSNTVNIAKECEIEFDFKSYHFPKYSLNDNGKSEEDMFKDQVYSGFERVMKIIKKKNENADENKYRERLEYEISVITKMGFPGYFLIVSDFIRYAKNRNIPVGPGRGSAVGSLVSYCLEITDLDPLEHGLIFERFLNPARISMPDIDVDFCINGREEVFKYVSERYGGSDYVAQIITFGTLTPRVVIRDVGRALGMPLSEFDAIAKMVPDELKITIDKAIKDEPKLNELVKINSEVKDLIDICRVLEDLPRHSSTHAAGVVISDKPLVEYMPVYKGKKGEVVSQFDMKIVEKIGLVKFDFLGLRNLTVIKNAIELIKNQNKILPDMAHLELNDKATYDLLSAGDTTGVFQFESSGMKDWLIKLKPACFGDITAMVALYRPGPLGSGMVDDFVERKHGRKQVEYFVPELEPVLKETYGVIVYQEQVMEIACRLAKYSMAEADGLRKAMGKKIVEIMAKHRKRFIEGSIENNIPESKATQLFDLMEKFGEYGFNKSHSAAYALIAYQTAYLKTHFPIEFTAALLTSEMDSSDNVSKFIDECRTHSLPILPPDINESSVDFTVSDSKIRFGLLAIKNVGEVAIESIIESRKEGLYNSLSDFCERVDLRKVNKRVIESLIKCGAFDTINPNRAQLLAALEIAMEYGQIVKKERDDPQMTLFEIGPKVLKQINAPVMPQIKPWDKKYLLEQEKESLGFYITGHPLDEYKEIIKRFSNANAILIKEVVNGAAVRVGGVIKKVKSIKTKKGTMMAFVGLEDMIGTIDVTVFSPFYDTVTSLLIEDKIVFIEGKMQNDDKSVSLIAEKIVPMETAEDIWTTSVHLSLDASKTQKETLKELQEIFKHHQGSCRTYLHIMIPKESEVIIALPDEIKLKSSSLLRDEVNTLLGYQSVYLSCNPIIDSNSQTNNMYSKYKQYKQAKQAIK
ncbi:MAG: DNA polymerase III subunit alpha [Desulfobacterales bacterium]|nr:DNA polymerase III subunit alpha [Desulfobacterales bacterium]